MIVINDLHLGVARSAGTTPRSASELTDWTHEQFSKILSRVDEDLLILGDLFDTYHVPLSSLLKTWKSLKDWLRKGHTLYLVPGNHDLSTDSSKLSSFHFLGSLLETWDNVIVCANAGHITADIYCIPHVPNQDLLNMELAKVPKCKYLLVHANYDNNFAKESDHSLNISAEQCRELPAEYVFFAHEHYSRTAMRGKVFIAGNQIPTSVSDCLHKVDKFMHRLADKPEALVTWEAAGYVEIDWRQPEASEAQFVRFVGHCSNDEAAAMAEVVARYRKNSEAFVVSNAVRVGNDDEGDSIKLDSLEAISNFKVMEALQDYLSPQDMKILESLHD